tara:strand:- start:1 stop:126 length:126 start_codon:yes stop_codon:yes gene_type:complete
MRHSCLLENKDSANNLRQEEQEVCHIAGNVFKKAGKEPGPV